MFLSTVKPQKTEILKMRFLVFSSHFNDKCSILALQNAPIGSFCNARMLHLAGRLSIKLSFSHNFDFGFPRFHCTNVTKSISANGVDSVEIEKHNVCKSFGWCWICK